MVDKQTGWYVAFKPVGMLGVFYDASLLFNSPFGGSPPFAYSNRRIKMAMQYAQWIVRRRWFVIVASILAVLALASGGTKLGFTNDYRVFFQEGNPQVEDYDYL